MTKRFKVLDSLPPEHQQIIRKYWADVKNESRQLEKRTQKFRQ